MNTHESSTTKRRKRVLAGFVFLQGIVLATFWVFTVKESPWWVAPAIVLPAAVLAWVVSYFAGALFRWQEKRLANQVNCPRCGEEHPQPFFRCRKCGRMDRRNIFFWLVAFGVIALYWYVSGLIVGE